MFYTDERHYRAIGLTLPKAKSSRDYIALFTKRLHKLRVLDHSDDGTEITHGLYLRSTRFRTAPDAEPADPLYQELTVTVGGKRKYAYDTYVVRITHQRTQLAVIAVPLVEMAMEVWEAIDVESRGTNLNYWRVNLGALLKSTSTISIAAPISVSSVLFDVKGDKSDAVVQLGLEADGVVMTKSFQHIMNLPSAQGPEVEPTWARFRLAGDGAPRFGLEADDFGNFRFYVGRLGTNLKGLGVLTDALSSLGCLVPMMGSPVQALRPTRKKSP